MVTTFNVRGLKDEGKLRHLLSHFSKLIVDRNKDVIVCLQETYLENPGKIPYIWRGNVHLTLGAGNSGWCVTILISYKNVVANCNLGNRAHFLACQKQGETAVSFIVANLYAPNSNSADKREFFNEVIAT